MRAHVCGRRPQPRLTTRHPAARELPRGRQDQEPNPRQPVALARRAHCATARRAARRQTAARHGGTEAVEIVRALPHGHVLAALGTARRIALDTVLPRRAPPRRRDLALALIVARLLEPAAKLATARMLDPATASHSLGEMLGLGKVAAKEVYAALDWLGREQPFIEAQLARRHLKDGALLLYDVTSTPAFARAGSTSKGAAANWRSMATAATIGATGRSWSSA